MTHGTSEHMWVSVRMRRVRLSRVCSGGVKAYAPPHTWARPPALGLVSSVLGICDPDSEANTPSVGCCCCAVLIRAP
eukprot:5733017-Prymnesium_polylepis.1